MSLFDKLSALVPFGKKEEILEYFFALNIGSGKLTAALWTVERKQLKILETAEEVYSSLENLPHLTDKLLDAVLGIREIEPQKILFGVPSNWLSDENLKEDYLKTLKHLVKELELSPMAYVETAHALVHFLEKQEGIPPTAILIGFEPKHLMVTVVRAGKLDGVKTISRGDSTGADIEKALLTFTSVETLPSKILLYGSNVSELKSQLLSFPWMSKLSFLHFPKMEVMPEGMDIKSVCLAGASEIEGEVYFNYKEQANGQVTKKPIVLHTKESEEEEISSPQIGASKSLAETENLGFMVGDISDQVQEEEKKVALGEDQEEAFEQDISRSEELVVPSQTSPAEVEEAVEEKPRAGFSLNGFIQPLRFFSLKKGKPLALLLGIVGVLGVILGAYLFLPKASVKIFVEPKILEKDTQVTADPNQKEVNEDGKIIPGQVVETEVSGSAKGTATGKKQVGDPAKGTVKIINNSDQAQSFSRGTTITSSGGVKFTMDVGVNIASTSALSTSKSTANVTVTATAVGADGNLASGTQFTVSSSSQVAIISEGNFSGGTSKEVTVVSSDDQNKLLASLSSDLRRSAQQKLQEKLPDKKVLEEALNETNVKKSFSKNVNDQASEFSLNLTVKYKGTAFEDKDLKQIVSKLIDTQVPEGFKLKLEDTETQADVSKLEKDGKLLFLARFKAKLMPEIEPDKVKDQIKGKSAIEAINIIKGMENVLGAEIKVSPSLPPILQRLPFLSQNIDIEVGLK